MQLRNALFFSLALSSNLHAINPQTTHSSIKFPLSNKTYQVLNSRAQALHSTKLTTAITKTSLPAEKQLGMNNVPVLDQGESHFDSEYSTTAAIDAALNRGDYISQLCLIQLSHYITKEEGAFSRVTLSRLENYGFIMKKRQKDAGCEEKSFINYEDYHKYSKNLINNGIIWTPILDMNKAIYERTDTGKTLTEIQQALNKGNRIIFSFITPQMNGNETDIGTIGTHHVQNDTWLLSAKIERALYNKEELQLFLHSMIITGYDNEAITLDDKGQKHYGLLTLRSSWGNEAGDHGDFYMSYDYFRVLVIEAQQIISLDLGSN